MRAIAITARHASAPSVDATGGVFVPDRERNLIAPVYTYGPPDSTDRKPVFSCPVSAIPAAVWALLDLWWSCRSMRALPLAGGVLDQPVSVRRAFPIFELEYAAVDARRSAAFMGSAIAGVFGGDR